MDNASQSPAGLETSEPALRCQILIIGGGAGGISVAASLKRRRPELDIALVEPSERHFYQPGWTLVGAGVMSSAATERQEAGLIPKGVRWLKTAASAFLPETNRVRLADGRVVVYDYLVACPGLKLDWAKIEGLTQTLGRNGVCSNYSFETAPYTHECVKTFSGGTAVFTQPPMPIKCAGAPQKALYLTADYLRRHNRLAGANLEFCLAGDVLFGVPFFVPPLQKKVDEYGIKLNFKHNLIAVDGASKKATFAVVDKDGKSTEKTIAFDMLHVVPPQAPIDAVRDSALVNAAGWIDVDPGTLRHTRFANIFGIGDALGTTNAKTAAAVRMQVPVVTANLLALLEGKSLPKTYDGYGACPLTVAYGKIVLAEFLYGGKVAPSFPFDPRVPSRFAWFLKTTIMPLLYWHQMLNGYELDIGHHEKQFLA
ncbi:NAD(P)/FAD-dependent oxidoreductase [Beijerinckia indica]|uniref:FAD-dependent pyridine nucleotide-disulphide oxidoreductase n=1 Tax=Beijerinckia indica subsp. indica (strain ATCC 9039 / DSM 1715 / NCIMB 8712) TaxID=395963 RepID=B2IEG4_BEII9|nr:FAD/NAD(P)-binding oxidoreductase [Beijerinckia indica]ACB95562.1 FAD-dependent pyridine nucleotide-disulphide oxidoreductase [Beijerinckia indica subsp. indica ATCC 9039]